MIQSTSHGNHLEGSRYGHRQPSHVAVRTGKPPVECDLPYPISGTVQVKLAASNDTAGSCRWPQVIPGARHQSHTAQTLKRASVF